MTEETIEQRAQRMCAGRCLWMLCTGKGSTHHTAHRCGLSELVPDPDPCSRCGHPSILRIPSGERLCDDCAPVQPVPDPARAAEALACRELPGPDPARYGTATGDPLGRTGPLNQYRIPTYPEESA